MAEIIKQLGIYENDTWRIGEIGAKAENISLTTAVAGKGDVQSALSQLCGLQALEKGKAIITDPSSGVLKASSITSTQLEYLSGLTESLKTTIDTINTKIANTNNSIATVNNKIGNCTQVDWKQTNSGNNYKAYWKFADGTLICAITINQNVAMTTAWSGMYESSGAINFGQWPLAFKQQPYISTSCVARSGNIGVMCIIEKLQSATSTDVGKAFLLSPKSVTGEVGIHIIGIGRWK